MCAQLFLTLCEPMDYSPPGSSVHGIFQTRILEWVAISYSRGSSQPRDLTCTSCTAGILNSWATGETLRSKESPLYRNCMLGTPNTGDGWPLREARKISVRHYVSSQGQKYWKHLITVPVQREYIHVSPSFLRCNAGGIRIHSKRRGGMKAIA